MKKFKLIAILLFTSFVFFSCVSVKEKKDIYVIHDIQNTDKYDTDVKIPIFANEKALNSLISNVPTCEIQYIYAAIEYTLNFLSFIDSKAKHIIINILSWQFMYYNGSNFKLSTT